MVTGVSKRDLDLVGTYNGQAGFVYTISVRDV